MTLGRPSTTKRERPLTMSTPRATFPLDFTEQFLSQTSLDRLRHIFVALCLQQQHVPSLLMPTAA